MHITACHYLCTQGTGRLLIHLLPGAGSLGLLGQPASPTSTASAPTAVLAPLTWLQACHGLLISGLGWLLSSWHHFSSGLKACFEPCFEPLSDCIPSMPWQLPLHGGVSGSSLPLYHAHSEHLQCARFCAGRWSFRAQGTTAPAFQELIAWEDRCWGESLCLWLWGHIRMALPLTKSSYTGKMGEKVQNGRSRTILSVRPRC